MGERIFKTLDEQIDILSSRGLKISERDTAKMFLLNNNYYRVSGYSLTLRNHDVFYEAATFQNIMDIYSFDAELRHILALYIEKLEIKLKSIYAYEFAKRYGSLSYLTNSNFDNFADWGRIIAKANEQKEKSKELEAFIKHYVDDLKEDMPIWVFVELFTISDISMLYSISKPELKQIVAADFGFTMNQGAKILEDNMHVITILRNICAHGSRLFNRLFIRKPNLSSKERKLLKTDENGIVDNAHLYGIIIAMKRLLEEEDFEQLKKRIIDLSNRYPFVSMQYYGFREDWKELL